MESEKSFIRKILEKVDTRKPSGIFPFIRGHSEKAVVNRCVTLGKRGLLSISSSKDLSGPSAPVVFKLTAKGQRYLSDLRIGKY